MAQAKLEGRLQNTAKNRMMGCACNTARAEQEQGHQIGKTLFTAVRPLVITFLPCGGQTAHGEDVPCQPRATSTNQHRNQQNTCRQQIRLRERSLQRQGTNAEQTDQEATNTTAHQQNRYSGHDVTINRPHARRPTPNWPDLHGLIRERRPTGWQHRDEPRPPTTMTTNTAEHRNSTTADGANQRSQTTPHYTWTTHDATNQHRLHGQDLMIRPPAAAQRNPHAPSRP